MNSLLENNPLRHTHKVKTQLRQIIQHLRGEVGTVTEAKAQTLFEKSAEVLSGLVQAFDDYERKTARTGCAAPMPTSANERSPHAARR